MKQIHFSLFYLVLIQSSSLFFFSFFSLLIHSYLHHLLDSTLFVKELKWQLLMIFAIVVDYQETKILVVLDLNCYLSERLAEGIAISLGYLEYLVKKDLFYLK